MRVSSRRVITSWLVIVSLLVAGCGSAIGSEGTQSSDALRPIFPEVDDLSFGADLDPSDSLCFYAASPSWGLEMDERCFETPHLEVLEFVGAQTVMVPDGSEETASLLVSAFDIEVEAVEQSGVPIPWQQRGGALLALAGFISAEAPILVTFSDGQTVNECSFAAAPRESSCLSG